MVNCDFENLNEEQKKALIQTEGVVLVTAGAGSGKTRLLTSRIAYLIANLRVDESRILAITFTNKATKEMKTRLQDMGICGVWVSTFHSFCLKVLRREIDVLPPFSNDFTIYNDDDRKKVLKEVFEALEIDDEGTVQDVETYLSAWKNSALSFGDFFAGLKTANLYNYDNIFDAVKEYQQILCKNNALDFDDLLVYTLEIFDKFPEIKNFYANQFLYILVDEFQDTNFVQYEIVKRLASAYKNLFVVGDEDQCIYSWRGANFRNIFNLTKDFSGVRVFKLERNYRSTKNILNLANKVIKNNSERLDKNLWTENIDGKVPEVYCAINEKAEARYVAQEIIKLNKRGISFSDMAVLMRANAFSRNFEEAFLAYNIPHRIFGGFKFFDRAEILNIICYLRIFANPKDNLSLLKIINFPRRGIGNVAIKKIVENAQEKNTTILDIILKNQIFDEKIAKKLEKFAKTYQNLQKQQNELKLEDFVERVIFDFEIESAYQKQSDENEDRLANIDQFRTSVLDFCKENENAKLAMFLENITLQADGDEIKENGVVNIATIHSVKGLEFRAVFVVALEEQIFPSRHSYALASDMEEERRLMYVALTRAEDFLYLTYAENRFIFGKNLHQTPSRFLKELGLVKQTVSIFDKVKIKEDEDFEKVQEKVSKFKVGQKVFHPKYLEGKIVEISADGLVADIEFEDFGKKSLMLEFAPLEII